MFAQLRNFLKHSLIYSISNIASKAIGIVLLPLYTSVIPLAEFGILAIVEVTIAIGVELLSFGQSQAILLFDNLQQYKETKRRIFFTSTAFLIVTGLVGIIGIYFVRYPLEYFFHVSKFLIDNALLVFSIITVRMLNDFFLGKLRSEERSLLYTIIGVIKLVFTLVVTIYFVAFQNMGIAGILYAYIIGDGIACVLLCLTVIQSMEFRFDLTILKTSLQLGFPLVFGSLAGMILNVSDRYIIRLYRTPEEVALYDLGYRVAGFLNIFIIMPFSIAWAPNALKMYEQPNAQRYFSKVMTYFTFLLVWVGLGLALFSKELIKFFALNPAYWPSYTIVPIITLAYVFLGMRLVSVLGIYLTKQTRYIGVTTIACALCNVVANFILVPRYGMMAAAYTTLGAFLLLHIISNIISDRYYKIPFEQWKLLILIGIGVVLFIGTTSISFGNKSITFAMKSIIVIIFPGILYPFRFYEEIELQTIKNIITKRPSQWFEIIKNIAEK